MRRRLGVSCESPNSFCSQLYPLRTPSCGTASSLPRTPVISTTRGLVSASVNASGHARTVENEPRALAAVPPSGDAPAPHAFGSNVANNVVMGVTPGRGQGTRTDAGSVATTATTATRSGTYASSPESSALLDDFLLEHMHRAPTGMADRIAAASERHENRQRGQHQQGQQPQPQTQPQQGGLRKSPQGPAHDPESSRLWEARLLSRACQSLAFHISSHFHVPTDATDPLSSVLSASTPPSTTVTTASGSPVSGSGTYTPSLLLLLPPAPHGGVTVGLGADLTAPGQNGDLHGVYDNLPAVYALKAVAGSLLDPALWRAPLPLPQPPSKPLRTSADTPPSSSHSHSHPLDQQSPGGKGASQQPSHAAYPGAAAAGAQSPHSEAPSAMNALIHVVSGALLRLAHACGHSGCYTLIGQPPPPQSLSPGGAAPAPLAGVSFATDRQLARLYDMACAAGDVDVSALAGVPSSTAAALLVLLAAAQPPPHPAVEAATARLAGDAAVAATSGGGGGGPPTIPAALLARYLRIGSRSHNPLDTVRVMWALLRLQLPGAGSLLLPLQPGGDSGSSSSDEEGGAAAIAGVNPPQDAMTQLAAILSRQLRNRDRALAALRAARPGELYGTWQLAVQTLLLLRDRAAAAERSAVALEQLDSALALLEAALTGSESGSGSGPESGYGSGSASPEIGAVHVGAQQHPQGPRRTGRSKGTAGGEPVGAGSPAATPPAVEALQAFLDLSREVSAAREEAAAAAAAAAAASATACGADPFFSPAGPTPAWDVVPRSDAEWRRVLSDTEQRAALLLSTWPELRRLVEPLPPSPRQAQQPQQQQAAAAGTEADAEGKAGAGEEPGPGTGTGTCPAEAVGGAAGGLGGSGAEQASAADQPEGAVQRRRLRLHLQSYSAMHFRTLELLYRAVKAQAPDARLLAPLSAPDAAAAAVAASTADAAPGAATGGGGGDEDDAAASSRRILDAVALPYSAAVDMVFTDARGRRVGLCLAHLGASRRAPGELAVLQHALAGWPEADAAAAQQGFRAARAVAAAAAAHAKARAARTAAAAKAAATAFVMVGAAAAAVTAAAGDAATRPWTGGDAAMAAPQATAVPDEAAAAVTTVVDAAAVRTAPAAGGDDDDCLSVEERTLAEAAAAALEADAAAAAAAPDAAAAAAAEAAAAAARAAGPTVAGLEDPGRRQVLELDDVVVLELDHDWFHLRESYYDHVRQTDKWDEDVREAVGAAMSYTVLPWEAQLDMVWHVLAGAGVRLPIRVFA